MATFYPKSREKTLSAALFENPGSEYRAAPFWSWNNRLDKDQLLRQIDVMKEMGLGGFHMHPRTGLGTQYLSEEFMQMIKACVNKAKNDKMRAYLYDEDRWPSGFAGGYVTKKPENRQHSLLFTPVPYGKGEIKSINDSAAVGGRAENGTLLAAYDIVLAEDGTLLSGGRIEKQQAVKGKKWYAYMETATETTWFNNQTYVDTLNPKAMKDFIDITYESYLAAVGSDFGDTVQSIFTDEPQFSHKQTLDFAKEEKDVTLPWTPDFPETFRAAYGFDILDQLPQLIWDLPNGKPSKARYCYHDHIAERFAQAFADQCGGWCSAHGIALTGHMMEEPTLQSQTAALGDAMRSYRSFELPGIDMLCNGTEFTTAKQAQSAVHQYGREGMLSELYGVTGWDFDFRGHKFQGDWQAALGVTLRVPHLAWVSMEGEAKRDYPASISYQSPWYKEYSYVEDHFARLNTALTRGKPIVRIGVIHPVESCWLYWGPKEQDALIRQTLDENFNQITDWLIFGAYDFNFISESLLPGQCKKAGNPLKVGEMSYDVVIVPDCRTLRGSTLERLRGFAQAGGTVIFMGNVPEFVDAEPSEAAKELCAQATHISFDRSALFEALAPFTEVLIREMDGRRTEDLITQYRADGDASWLFVTSGREADNPDVVSGRTVKITVGGCKKAEIYNTVTGRIEPVSYEARAERTTVTVAVYAYQSLLLHFTPGKAEKVLLPDALPLQKALSFLHPVDYRLSEDNALLLDMAEYALDDEAYAPKEEMLRLDNILRGKAGLSLRGGQIAQPWVTAGSVKPAEHIARMRFTFESEKAFAGCKLALEHAGKAQIVLNGKEVENQVCGYYVDEAIQTVKLPMLAEGKNRLEISYPLTEDLGLEWCYLLGAFGVRLIGTDAVLTELPRKLGFGSIVSQGLPFYTGNVVYSFEFELPKEQNAGLHVSQYRGGCMRVSCDGKDAGILAYPPYEVSLGRLGGGKHRVDITLYGNRANGFGAVHNCVKVGWAGSAPSAWRTTDDSFCYEYQLLPLGILSSPQLRLY